MVTNNMLTGNTQYVQHGNTHIGTHFKSTYSHIESLHGNKQYVQCILYWKALHGDTHAFKLDMGRQ